jgi:hypothetical protein
MISRYYCGICLKSAIKVQKSFFGLFYNSGTITDGEQGRI